MNKTSSLPAVVIVLASLSTGVSERYMSNWSEALSLLIYLDSAMFAMQRVFTLIKTLCRKKMGETTAEEFKMSTQYGWCASLKNLPTWALCSYEVPTEILAKWTQISFYGETISKSWLFFFPDLHPCRKTMECIFAYHRDVKLLLLSMIPISLCLFFSF